MGSGDMDIEGTLQSCIQISKEVELALDELRPRSNSAVHKFVAAVQSTWKERSLDRLLDRLHNVREDLMLKISLIMM